MDKSIPIKLKFGTCPGQDLQGHPPVVNTTTTSQEDSHEKYLACFRQVKL